MIEKRAWHQPRVQLLDAGNTEQTPDPGTGGDHFFADPQGEGDLPETSESASAFGSPHANLDAS